MNNDNAEPVTRVEQLFSIPEIAQTVRQHAATLNAIAHTLDCDTCGARPAWPYDWRPRDHVGTWEYMCDACEQHRNPHGDLWPWPWSGKGPVPPTIYADPGETDG